MDFEAGGAVGQGVIVAGGGVAGIAAAVRLAEAGVAVTLIETRRKLGGRATSFVDVRTGLTLDNCQHVVLGCCTNYLDLLDRLGASGSIDWYDQQYWVQAGDEPAERPGAQGESDGAGDREGEHAGRMVMSVVRPGAFAAPLHFAESMARAKFLSWGEVGAIGRACAAIMREDRRAWHGRTFGEYLAARCPQPVRAVRRFWNAVIVSACNLAVERVSAVAALQVFQEGFLASRAASRIGVPRVALTGLYERVGGLIEDAGGNVMLGASVEELDEHGVRLGDGQRLEARAVVCALPFERAARVASARVRARDERFGMLEGLGHSPILGVHLCLDRPVLHVPHAVLVDRETQWVFRKSAGAEHGAASGEQQVLHAVISGADAWMELPEERIAARVMDDLRACFPAARDAGMVWSRAVKERRATFAATPEAERFRPDTAGPSGVILAGDYTRTGWPATMEGAARSGYAAAAAVLGEAPSATVMPDLAPSPLARWMGLRVNEAGVS